MAEVSKEREVSVEGEFVGRIEGFLFSQDSKASPEQAKTLRAAAYQALAPEFHLRADRFYNAPDTEIDFTDQGGLMWGDQAVGKLVAGDEALKPRVVPFVDEEAGDDVAQKVTRRLQHFIDRKIAALFEPLFNIQHDEELSGLARGFGFRMIEALGLIPRDQVMGEVKELDQDARGALRKHGVRFGQFTIFMPLLLKPAPTRLRLLLWSLREGHDEFSESPPPGLVTIPTAKGAHPGYHLMSGYRQAGERAIRVDMLERLADLLRAEDSRGGFEASPDMLSITGMTLEQFADLMQGLGYAAERSEREKVKPEPVAEATTEATDTAPDAPETPADTTAQAAPTQIDAEAEAPAETDAPAETAPVDEATTEPASNEEAGPEIEVFYSFTWARRRPNQQGERRGGKPQGQNQGKPRGKPKGKRPPQQQGARSYQAKPQKKDRIDPDNPFAAALMGLKDKN